MASTKIKDLAVKVGSYTDRSSGQEKGRYENVGALMQSDDGNMFVMLKRTFNPAGVPGNADRDSLLISAFDPQQRDGQQNNQTPRGNAPPQSGGAPAGGRSDMDDEIPFLMEWR
jgi:hypothetical protein